MTSLQRERVLCFHFPSVWPEVQRTTPMFCSLTETCCITGNGESQQQPFFMLGICRWIWQLAVFPNEVKWTNNQVGKLSVWNQSCQVDDHKSVALFLRRLQSLAKMTRTDLHFLPPVSPVRCAEKCAYSCNASAALELARSKMQYGASFAYLSAEVRSLPLLELLGQ